MNLISNPWHLVFFTGFIFYFGIRHVFIQRTKGERKIDSQFDGLEKTLLAGMSLAVLLLPLAFLFTPWLAFADYQLPAFWQGLGAVTMVASLWLFWRSHTDLGQNWSVSLELRANHELVTHGIYRRVRHPMYASIWLWALAQGLLLSNWLAGWAVVVPFTAMYALRIPREERMMSEKFGESYHNYMRNTGRLFPSKAICRNTSRKSRTK